MSDPAPVSALDQIASSTSLSVRLVDKVARGLGAVSRRGFLLQAAVVGSALVADPKRYVLTPVSAYSSLCGPAATLSSGYTVFCCTVNNGRNTCPPGSFAAGWWKAAHSSWCCGGYRYIVDCNATCTSCGCSGGHICSRSCWSCRCGHGSSATCDQRRYCCNGFRYGQCNTQVRCSGGVVCRVVSCVPPYKWDNCTTTSLSDDTTAEHNAPCLQGCGAILKRYNAIGANGSVLGASLGPERAVGDGRGRYVAYEHGWIYWTSATGAQVVRGGIGARWHSQSGWALIGYPRAEELAASGTGRHQEFERGSVYWKHATGAQIIRGAVRARWLGLGGPTSLLGYPTTQEVDAPPVAGARRQEFERGTICWSRASGANPVRGAVRARWLLLGGVGSVLGLPLSDEVPTASGTRQSFVGGTMAWSRTTGAWPVRGAVLTRWAALGYATSSVGFPLAGERVGRDGRGVGQVFAAGQLWALNGGTAYVLTGAVLQQWLADGAETSHWGYPLSDVVRDASGTEQASFEGGTLSVPPAPTPTPTPTSSP